MNERESLIAISSFVPFGPVRIKLLLSFFGSAQAVWKAPVSRLSKLGLGEEKIRQFAKFRREFNSNYFIRLEKSNIEVKTFKDKDFPQNLKDLSDAPVVLYFKGAIKQSDINSIAIVGSRKMTSYGRDVANKFSYELATFGITIVSGLARGIDTVAHKGALSAGGRTIAVLGCGMDLIYPPENTSLAREIAASGALISEYPLGVPAIPINFAARNRIISGLAKAVVVIEGAEKSGTLLTASHAANQGKTVLAVPGQITSPLSAAPLFLIKNGAKMAISTSDILEELDLSPTTNCEAFEKIIPSTKEEETFAKVLENEPLHLDEIARILSLDVAEVSARLTVMELKGLVKNMGRGVYKKL
jgi:DNA processing protein